MSRRTVTLPVGHVEVNKSWRDPTLTISYDDKKAVLQIRDPWELRYLRDRLNEIEAYWKSCVNIPE